MIIDRRKIGDKTKLTVSYSLEYNNNESPLEGQYFSDKYHEEKLIKFIHEDVIGKHTPAKLREILLNLKKSIPFDESINKLISELYYIVEKLEGKTGGF